jgi:hypothetical protein
MVNLGSKNFFIYGNGEKIWIVFDEQIIEIKSYVIDSFDFSIERNCVEQELIGCPEPYLVEGRTSMGFGLHAIVDDASFKEKKNVDVSDFYSIEECKKLSKIIQRKFDKILEEKE